MCHIPDLRAYQKCRTGTVLTNSYSEIVHINLIIRSTMYPVLLREERQIMVEALSGNTRSAGERLSVINILPLGQSKRLNRH